MPKSKVFSGQRLRELREGARVSRMDLAYACRRTEQMVYLWERDRSRPRAELLDQIATTLRVERNELFVDAEDNARV